MSIFSHHHGVITTAAFIKLPVKKSKTRFSIDRHQRQCIAACILAGHLILDEMSIARFHNAAKATEFVNGLRMSVAGRRRNSAKNRT